MKLVVKKMVQPPPIPKPTKVKIGIRINGTMQSRPLPPEVDELAYKLAARLSATTLPSPEWQRKDRKSVV